MANCHICQTEVIEQSINDNWDGEGYCPQCGQRVSTRGSVSNMMVSCAEAGRKGLRGAEGLLPWTDVYVRKSVRGAKGYRVGHELYNEDHRMIGVNP